MMRMALAPSPVRSRSRRATSVVKIGSARSGRVLISRRNSSGGMASTRPAWLTRAVSHARCPVSRLSSPRKRPTPWVAMTTSPSVSGRTISVSPSSTTKKS